MNTLQSMGGFTTNYVTNANGTVTITSMTKLVSFGIDLRVALMFLAIVGIVIAYFIFAHRRSGSN
ncbi:MAG: hypothetical protein JWR26_4331 [Pedosphaera sp.]|nr:hypothetical protein [Pedosphaera sp.]